MLKYIVMNYYDKYLKYKSKYIQLKLNENYIHYGGDKPLLNNKDIINFLATFVKLVRSDIRIKNNIMKSDSILVNETRTLWNE